MSSSEKGAQRRVVFRPLELGCMGIRITSQQEARATIRYGQPILPVAFQVQLLATMMLSPHLLTLLENKLFTTQAMRIMMLSPNSLRHSFAVFGLLRDPRVWAWTGICEG